MYYLLSIFSSTPYVVRRTTHGKLVESHSLLIAMHVGSTKRLIRLCMEDHMPVVPLPNPGSALALHYPTVAPFLPPVTQMQGLSIPCPSWKEMKERKYSYTIPMKPSIGISARYISKKILVLFLLIPFLPPK